MTLALLKHNWAHALRREAPHPPALAGSPAFADALRAGAGPSAPLEPVAYEKRPADAPRP
jgi:hypothetical protein